MIGGRIGPYEVIASVGAGGMGEVYRARDTGLGCDVAIQVEPFCRREPFDDAQGKLRGSPQAKSRHRAEREGAISC